MNTTTIADEAYNSQIENIGSQFVNLRQQHGYSIEYVATKLHLRVRIIELLESGQFNLLPEPVFIKGYIRAYSKLLGVSPEPFLNVFNSYCGDEKKSERAALWQQAKPESHKAEHVIRWFTILFALGVVISVSIWWQKNRDVKQDLAQQQAETSLSLNQTKIDNEETTQELKLADVSAMQDILTPKAEMTPMENEVD